jgi:hypothetical protein
MVEMTNVSKSLVRECKGKRTLGRPRHRRDLKEIGWEGVDWIHLAQDRNQW